MVRRRSCAHPAALHSGTRLTRARSSAAGVTRAQAWPLSHLRRLAQPVNRAALPPRAVFVCSWRRGARRCGGPAATRSGTTSAKARRPVNPNGSVVKARGRCEAKVPFASRAQRLIWADLVIDLGRPPGRLAPEILERVAWDHHTRHATSPPSRTANCSSRRQSARIHDLRRSAQLVPESPGRVQECIPASRRADRAWGYVNPGKCK